MSKKDKVIFVFPVLWESWECDSRGEIHERPDGTRYLQMTNHGSPYEAKPTELGKKIHEYREAIKKTREALRLLSEHSSNLKSSKDVLCDSLSMWRKLHIQEGHT